MILQATLVDAAAGCPTTPPPAPYTAYVASAEAITLICDAGVVRYLQYENLFE